MRGSGFVRLVRSERVVNYLTFAVLFALVILFLVEPSFAQGAGYDDTKFGQICGRAVSYIESGFGALLACVAGLGAIVAAAAGGFRMAWACLVVSVGSFILRNYISLFFSGLCQ